MADVQTEPEANNSDNSNNQEEHQGCVKLFCHPTGSAHRFVVLIFLCFLGFGSYFCYDGPASLKSHFTGDLNLTDSQYGWLYSAYSWPNVFLCFVGGYLIDSVFGIRLGTNLFMGMTLIGQAIFALAVYFNLFWLMLIGRLVFGIGAESLAVGQNNYAVLWFKGKELNMVFGLQLSLARVGSTVNLLVMVAIYKAVNKSYQGPEGLGITLFIAGITCIFSMMCALILGLFDKRAERVLQRNSANANGETVRLRDILDFNISFWLISIVCVTYYVAIFPFIQFVQSYFMDKFDMTEDEANTVSSIVYLISGVASPILGFLIDKVGRNVFFMIIAISCTILAEAIIAFSTLNPYVGMSIIGLAYSGLASSLWPLVSQVIPDYQLGTAFGVCQAVQNLGLALMAIIGGVVSDKWGFQKLEIIFLGCLITALASAIVLYFVDIAKKGPLNMSPSQRRAYQEAHKKPENDEKVPTIEISSEEDREPIVEGEVKGSTEQAGENSDFQVRNSSPPPTI